MYEIPASKIDTASLTLDEQDRLLRQHRKKAIFDSSELPLRLNHGQDKIQTFLPHRPPVLFVDSIIGLDPENDKIAGTRFINPKDPVFEGHFPDSPVYPGTFTLEMLGQLGLCLFFYARYGHKEIVSNAEPVLARATRIHGAYFLEPILPGAEVLLLAQKLSFNGYLASILAQAIVDGKVAVVTIAEVIIL